MGNGRMSSRFQLHGGMIPRTVKRMFDERSEERIEGESHTAVLTVRGRNHIVPVLNLSHSGVMLRFAGDAHIGENVTVQLLDRGTISAQVRWLRDGRMGVYFASPLK
jgi:PilZ domain